MRLEPVSIRMEVDERGEVLLGLFLAFGLGFLLGLLGCLGHVVFLHRRRIVLEARLRAQKRLRVYARRRWLMTSC
jgi:hypothetical protein